MNAERRAPSSEPTRILLVEDSPDDHRLICDLLDSVAGTRYLIDWTRDLDVGRGRLETSRFDVCLIDHRLPGGDGLDLLQTAMVQGLMLPMIVLTGHGSLGLDRRAMALGAAGFLDKNQLDPVSLERTIRYAIRQQNVVTDLARLAVYDEGTGLVSRTLYRDRLTHALASARRRDRQVAVMIIDLDSKAANDRDRHRSDTCVNLAARRLTGILRETDTIARLADRQLALIIEGLQKAEHAALVAQKVLDGLAPSETPEGESDGAIPSVGIALYPKECGDGEALMRQAESAMRQARSEGGRRYRFGSERIDRHIHERFILSNKLQHALERQELKLRFRPQIQLTSDRAALSAEVFWDHPESDRMSMGEFLSVSGNPGLIDELADWMLAAAALQMRAWRAEGFGNINLALPFLPRRITDLEALERGIHDHLVAGGTSADRIEFDLAEDLVLGDLAAGGLGLAKLKATGVRLALDGFGRGEATLEDFKRDLLDSIKLSPLLYRNLPGDRPRETLVEAIIRLGHDLDLRVVANGVRDERQFAFLKSAGCDAIQLRTACPPLSADAATSWLRQLHSGVVARPLSHHATQRPRKAETMVIRGPAIDHGRASSEPTLEPG